MLAAVKAIEADLAKTGPPGASALAIPPRTGDTEDDPFGYAELLACLDAKVEEIVAVVQRF